MDPIDRRLMLGAAGLAGVAALSKLGSIAQAGPLNPPAGPIAPTGRTLDELYARTARTDAGIAEPRIPVQSLPGSKSASHVISEPGSYYLTANLVGVAGLHAIEIESSNVSLDLAGFSLLSVPGSMRGVNVVPDNLHSITVAGGHLFGWSEQGGIDAGTARLVRLVDLTFRGDGGCAGAAGVGPGSLVERVTISQYCGGLFVEEASVVQDCTIYSCESGCFMRRAVARNCRVFNINGAAMYLETSGVVEQCEFRQCNGPGVQLHVGENALVQGSTFNRCNLGVLVQSARGVTISNNQFTLNPVAIQLDPGSRGVRVEDNNIDGDGEGIRATGEAAVIVRNSVRGSAAPYTVAPGNSHGPIVNVAGVGDISTVPNANHPWANFTY